MYFLNFEQRPDKADADCRANGARNSMGMTYNCKTTHIPGTRGVQGGAGGDGGYAGNSGILTCSVE